MSEARTDGSEPHGSGRHRGEAAPSEEDSTSSPGGRHRRDPQAR
ncbi:hypothetical protein [Streptomyces sp. NPDC093600]